MNLDVYSDQPLNPGWMSVFRRWISSGVFQAHWPAVRGEFSEGFVRFCETELNLTMLKPNSEWLEVQVRPGKERPNNAAFGIPGGRAGAQQRVHARVASHRPPRDRRWQTQSGSDQHVRTCSQTPPGAAWMADGSSDPARQDSERRATNLRAELLWCDSRLGVVPRRGRTGRLVARRVPRAWPRRSNQENTQ